MFNGPGDTNDWSVMPKYRVTMRVPSTQVIEADNPYQAAVIASDRHADGAEVVDVRPAVGRIAKSAGSQAAKKTTKKVAKKRRQLSPEARARLAQNLVKARAARAAKRKAAKKSPAKKKTAKRAAKKKTTKR
jgi:hypothetical protein